MNPMERLSGMRMAALKDLENASAQSPGLYRNSSRLSVAGIIKPIIEKDIYGTTDLRE
jgi:hypothetical protein